MIPYFFLPLVSCQVGFLPIFFPFLKFLGPNKIKFDDLFVVGGIPGKRVPEGFVDKVCVLISTP